MDEYLDKTDIDLEARLVLQSNNSPESSNVIKESASRRALSRISRGLAAVEHTIRVQENRSQLVQLFAVPVTTYCFPALFFGIQKSIELIVRMHPFDPQYAWRIIYLTAFHTYAPIGLFGGIICFLTYKLLIRTRIPRPFALIMALLCSFVIPVLVQILRDFNDTIGSSRLGGGTDFDFIFYQFFVYMPQVWGLGGLAGGISAMASLFLIHPLESRNLLLGHRETPLLENNSQ